MKVTYNHRHLVPVVAGLGMLSILGGVGVASSQEGQGDPFACTGEAYIVQDPVSGEPFEGQLFQVDQSKSDQFTFSAIGASHAEYNNIGFSVRDGFIYGVQLNADGNDGVIKVAADGSIVFGPTAPSCSSCGCDFPHLFDGLRLDAGDVSADGRHFYASQRGQGRLWILDITTDQPKIVGCPNISGTSGNVFDWAFNESDGNLYGGNGSQVERLDLAFSRRERFSITEDRVQVPLPPSDDNQKAFGGAWFDAQGHLFLYRNDGKILEIEDVTGDEPSMELIEVITGPSSSRNDGAACVQKRLGAAKMMETSDATMLPATITITYVFENFGDLAITELSSFDDLRPVFGDNPDIDDSGGGDWNFKGISSTPPELANPNFNGGDAVDQEVDNQLIAPGSSLAPVPDGGSVGEITVTLELRNRNVAGVFCNQIVVTGKVDNGSGEILIGDTSTAGLDSDPDGDGAPVERDPSCIEQVPVELQSFSID